MLLNLACLRFFSKLCAVEPTVLTTYPLFAKEVFDMVYHFDSLDTTRRQLAFQALTEITLSAEAKRVLANSQSELWFFKKLKFFYKLILFNLGPHNISKAMNHFGVAIAMGPADCRVRFLENLSIMMGVEHFSKPFENDAENVLQNMFIELGEPFPKMLCQYLQKPFEDLQNATLKLLLSLLKHKWSMKLLLKETA